ncbi:MAG: MarR family winged helix-turn-helix transcriptional regulator [bacterium]
MDSKLDLSTCETCVCLNLRKTSRAITQVYDRALQPVGLRATQFAILVVAARAQTITITNLARHLVMDRTTLTRNLRPLGKQGWIKITRGADQRTRFISLEKGGEEMLARALPLWRKAQERFVNGLERDRFRVLLGVLSETVRIAQEE